MNILEKIHELKLENEAMWEEQRKKHRNERQKAKLQQLEFSEEVIQKCVQAEPRDYAKWLIGFLATDDGDITHFFLDREMDPAFLIAKKDFTLTAAYGSGAKQIIVPEDINVTIDNPGHNTLYYMKDFKIEGWFTPLYSDVLAEIERLEK